jgi:hypothetical protein
MSPRTLLLLAALAAPLTLHAQPVYRCGNTFSNIPCSADATPVRPSAAPAAPSVGAEQVCLARIRAQFRDPASVRIEQVTGPKSEIIDYHGGRLVVKTYLLTVSMPQSAVYLGESRFECQLTENLQRVLSLRPAEPPSGAAPAQPTETGSLPAGIRHSLPSGAAPAR